MMSNAPLHNPREALARLLALAVMADGIPARSELDLLQGQGVLAALDMDVAAFEALMTSLCGELRATSPDGAGATSVGLPPDYVKRLVTGLDPALPVPAVGAAMLEVMLADERLTTNELRLLEVVMRCDAHRNDEPEHASPASRAAEMKKAAMLLA